MMSGSDTPELRLSLSCGSSDKDGHRLFRNSCEPQRIAILYDGRICECKVTEIQARQIISVAKQQMKSSETRVKQQIISESIVSSSSSSSSSSCSNEAAVQKLLNPGMSMKRSLQRFLQKRKSRVDTVSPYVYRRQHLSYESNLCKLKI